LQCFGDTVAVKRALQILLCAALAAGAACGKQEAAGPGPRVQKQPDADAPASGGASRDRARDLSEEADRQDAEFRKKKSAK
jgi:hypothetical protein